MTPGAEHESAVSIQLRRRFAKWCGSAPASTRWLAESVLAHLVPAIELHGFGWNNSFMARGEPPPRIRDQIPMERPRGDFLDVVHISFVAGSRPEFIVAFRAWSSDELARRQLCVPHFLAIRTALGRQRVHFGFSRLDPFASQRRAERIVATVVGFVPQLVECLEQGKCGPNVTPSRRNAPQQMS